jgi:hypothetical protein
MVVSSMRRRRFSYSRRMTPSSGATSIGGLVAGARGVEGPVRARYEATELDQEGGA